MLLGTQHCLRRHETPCFLLWQKLRTYVREIRFQISRRQREYVVGLFSEVDGIPSNSYNSGKIQCLSIQINLTINGINFASKLIPMGQNH